MRLHFCLVVLVTAAAAEENGARGDARTRGVEPQETSTPPNFYWMLLEMATSFFPTKQIYKRCLLARNEKF
ncbi:hypothetical protein TcWFU_005164 [Taenia crassiceps]|uniref:Secreted protein n=1 Tax=Taenia crassiceps TaxID=6207 RepID=A0ABR4PZ33_9CEST